MLESKVRQWQGSLPKEYYVYHIIPHENTFAFGDSANDLEMLAYVAHSIAMGNGTDKVKNTAEYVTRSVDEDGILHGLKHYGLI